MSVMCDLNKALPLPTELCHSRMCRSVVVPSFEQLYKVQYEVSVFANYFNIQLVVDNKVVVIVFAVGWANGRPKFHITTTYTQLARHVVWVDHLL